jgi:predicted aconitase with swiveling domain
MSIKIFKGRAVLSGEIEGEAVVSNVGFNTCAVYIDVMTKNADSGICMDHGNKDLYQKDLTNKIICLPSTIGSTSAACLYVSIAEKGLAPKAMLFANHIDTLAATGLIMADNWLDKRTITIDQLGAEILDSVNTGDTVFVLEDGTVKIHSD